MTASYSVAVTTDTHFSGTFQKYCVQTNVCFQVYPTPLLPALYKLLLFCNHTALNCVKKELT
jgi:hypothetical protein